MRTFAYALALLAAAKFGGQEYFHRTATEEALIAAYRDRAVEACRGDARARGLLTESIERAGDVRLVIGKNDVDVRLWDISNSLWATRYRAPYLQLRLGAGKSGLGCEYDITHQVAMIAR